MIEMIKNTFMALLAAACGAILVIFIALHNPAFAAPNMVLTGGSFACKTITNLEYAERMNFNEPVLEIQKAEVNNGCTTIKEDKDVTAFDIGVTAKVEFFALGKLDVYYVNTRDLRKYTETK